MQSCLSSHATRFVHDQSSHYIGFLPTWGDKVLRWWGEGPEIFTPENAEIYGRFLGKRYGTRPNIIWVLGGDRAAEREHDFAVWRAMARGIKAGEATNENGFSHLMTYHPPDSRSSSEFFHNDDWLDFNMFHTGHNHKDGASYRLAARDYSIEPVKPTLDGEPPYDNHPVRRDPTRTQWFDDFDVRQVAYWSIFSGAFGHTYGCHDIWQMYDGTPERQCTDARTPWKQAVDLPGAWQMRILRSLMLDKRLLTDGNVPFQELLVGDNPEGAGYVAICVTRNRERAFVYVPTGRSIVLDLSKLNLTGTPKFVLFNPRTGETTSEIDIMKDGNFYAVTFPGREERGNDWVIIVE